MSTPVSPSTLTPPSSEQRDFTQERSVERMEAARRHLVSRIGFLAALLTAVLGFAWYAAAFADMILGLLPYPWGLVAQCTPSLFLAPEIRLHYHNSRCSPAPKVQHLSSWNTLSGMRRPPYYRLFGRHI